MLGQICRKWLVMVIALLCGTLLAGCAAVNALAGDESRHESTKQEDAVDRALARCVAELAIKDDESWHVNRPNEGPDDVRDALKDVEAAQSIARADQALANRTWPFPWNKRSATATTVAAGLTYCRTELPIHLVARQALANRHQREDDAWAKIRKDEREQAIASSGPQRQSVLRLHGLPQEYKRGTEWQRASHWNYSHQAGDSTNGFYVCQISYFFEGETLVASNASPPNCANIIEP